MGPTLEAARGLGFSLPPLPAGPPAFLHHRRLRAAATTTAAAGAVGLIDDPFQKTRHRPHTHGAPAAAAMERSQEPAAVAVERARMVVVGGGSAGLAVGAAFRAQAAAGPSRVGPGPGGGQWDSLGALTPCRPRPEPRGRTLVNSAPHTAQ